MIGYTDYFVICTGRTDRQTKAIHDAIHKGMKQDHGLLPRRVEGLGQARWILMDYLDVVVHVFTPETREYYRLEQLWGEAPARPSSRRSTERRRRLELGASLRPVSERREQLRRDLLLAAHHARELDRAVLGGRRRRRAPRAAVSPATSSSVPLLEHVGDHQRVELQARLFSRSSRIAASSSVLRSSSASPTTSIWAMQISWPLPTW